MKDVEAKRILTSVAGDDLMLARILERSPMDDPLFREQTEPRP
jgi:hypothetical protein